MKESYNPFKMWGSWVGFIILGFFGLQLCLDLVGFSSCPDLSERLQAAIRNPDGYLLFGLFGIVGFLLGWAIHSLARKLT